MTAMLVETFEVTEVDAEGQPECEAEALELIEQLGLAGQKKLVAPDKSGEAQRSPYRKMTKEERLVYKAVCPQSKKLKEYADSPIPVRVLQVAAHALSLNQFDEIQVWSAESADIKDPVLIGFNENNYSYEYFLLARWGEVLEPLAKLKAVAAATIRTKRASALKGIISDSQAKLAACEHLDDDAMLELSESPSISDYNNRNI